jgi:hypothetical protein
VSTAIALFEPTDLVHEPGSPEYQKQVECGAVELARIFAEETAHIRAAWQTISQSCRTLSNAMRPTPKEDKFWHSPFDVRIYHEGRQHYDYQDKSAIDSVLKQFNIDTWALLIDRMGIKQIMSVKKREAFEKQIKDGDVPEVTAENILGVIMGLADRAADFATEAAKETLTILTPSSGHYKTNSGFKVGKRVVLSYYVERAWGGGFRVSYYREPQLIAIDGTFHILDGKGPCRDRKSPLYQAIEQAKDGRGETDYFKFRAFKNRNLHLEFKRLDLVKKLNGLATGEFVLGQDPN